MKRVLKTISGVIAGLLLVPFIALAAAIVVPQGGTGATSFTSGALLKGNSTGAIQPLVGTAVGDLVQWNGSAWTNVTVASLGLSQDGTFSTTSAAYWDTTVWRWSTTSADYWETQQAARGVDGTFSTTSADYFITQRNFFSTTSAQHFLSLNQGAAFSTTSADYWGGTKGYLTTVDISSNTNLAATYPVILTGDTLSFPATSTLYGTGTAGYVLGWTNGGPGWVATSSAIAWGAITGTLSSQTDLNAKFLTKLGTSSALTANEVVYATAFNTVASIATGTLSCTSPVSCTSRAVLQGASAISIANAAADGSTKGAASFTAADFDASSGNISLDRAITGTFTGAWAFTNAASTTIAKGLYANTIAASYLMATSTTAWNTLPNILTTNASTTNVSVSNWLGVPYSTDPTVSGTGGVYVNTTVASSGIRYFDGTAEREVSPFGNGGIPFASSTLAYSGSYGTAGTTTMKYMRVHKPFSLIALYCDTDTGTAYVSIGNGSATTTMQCTTGGGTRTTSSVTWTMGQAVFIGIGQSASSPNIITLSPELRKDPD